MDIGKKKKKKKKKKRWKQKNVVKIYHLKKKIEETISNYDFESLLEHVIEDFDFDEVVSRMVTERIEDGDINIEETIEDFISRELYSISFEDEINEAIENALYNS